MAEIREAVAARLKGFAPLAALVGDRVYPKKLPQNAAMPAVVYFVAGNAKSSSMGVDDDWARPRFQIDIYADGYSSAAAVAAAIAGKGGALRRWRGAEAGVTILDSFFLNEIEPDEPDDQRHHTALDFEIIHRE